MIKPDILNVLIYLFENYVEDEQGILTEDTMVHQELENVGFHSQHISKAMEWLEDLALLKTEPLVLSDDHDLSFRIFSKLECERISTEARSFLLSMEQQGSIDANIREMILERAMALEMGNIDLQQMQWVAMIVLLNTSSSDLHYIWTQDLILQTRQYLH